jgi:hypothetical protein
MFGISYNFEDIFLSSKINKQKKVSSISNKPLNEFIKIFAANNLFPNFDKIIPYIHCYPNSENNSQFIRLFSNSESRFLNNFNVHFRDKHFQ